MTKLNSNIDGDERGFSTPMRTRVSKTGGVKRSYSYRHYPREAYKELRKFIEARIGKNFDKVFHEFCEKYPTTYKGINTREEFLDMFPAEHERVYRGSFYVDKNKCIRKYAVAPRPKKHVKFYAESDRTIIKYRFNVAFIKDNPAIYDICRRTCGAEFAYILVNENNIVSEHDYVKFNCSRMIDEVNDWVYMHLNEVNLTHAYALVPEIRKEYCMERIHARRKALANGVSPKDRHDYYVKNYCSELLYKTFDDTKYTTLYKGDDDWMKYQAERTDARNKASREWQKHRAEILDTLLWRLEHEKKEKERQSDLIKRDSHGFDEHSFIGHPYHGQKRKNK